MKQFSTSDITKGLDLLKDFLDAKGYTEEAGLCTKAMDEINRLRDLVQTLLDNEPDDLISDAGHTVLDLWRVKARAAMRESDE